jgi:hypothetical protein
VVFRTVDGGNSWQAISPDLTREDPGVPSNLDPAAAADAPQQKQRGVVYTIAPSYVRAEVIWAGTDDGLIQLTQDGGKTWANVTPSVLMPWSKLTHIESSHFDAGTAYAAVDRHRLEDLQPYLYRTRDFGKTWQRISNGIPNGSFLNCVREDPVQKELLYACTEKGVFVSFNDGERWQPLQLNLPVTSVRDLVVHGDDLVIATHGRSFWVLDDITSLRQLSPRVAAADVWLFQPQTAYRVKPPSDEGTPLPLDEPLAENAPSGALLDYYLKEKPPGPVVLEIFDGNGQLVRRYSSNDGLQKTDPNKVPISPSWIHDAMSLSSEAGMHRFSWDLHFPLPKTVQKSFYGPSGPWALPGHYTAKLSVNGQTLSQSFIVKMDPRVKMTEADLDKQFQAASTVTAILAEVSAANQQAAALRQQIDAHHKNAKASAQVIQALTDLDAKLSALTKNAAAGEFGLSALRLPGKEPASLGTAVATLRGLLIVVESADVAPTTDASAAVEKWDAASKDALARWKLLQPEIDRINVSLQKANLPSLDKEARGKQDEGSDE